MTLLARPFQASILALLSVLAGCDSSTGDGGETGTQMGTGTDTDVGTDTGTGTGTGCVYDVAADCPSTPPESGGTCAQADTYCEYDLICGAYPNTSKAQFLCRADNTWSDIIEGMGFYDCDGGGTSIGSPGLEPCPCQMPVAGQPCGDNTAWMGQTTNICRYDDSCNGFMCDGVPADWPMAEGVWVAVDGCDN